MDFFIANTDLHWFNQLKTLNPEDVNFWQPGGTMRFKAIPEGAPFLFKLKYPIKKIAGVGFFSSHSLLPIDFAWEVFHDRNGTPTYEELYRRIDSYRSISHKLRINPNIGCIVITNPTFFDEPDWIPTPLDWSKNIIQGKKYSTAIIIGNDIWNRVQQIFQSTSIKQTYDESHTYPDLEQTEEKRYGKEILVKPRMGQGAFRIKITDTYNRKYAISGEKTLPVLEAAHIRPFEKEGPNTVENGLLLRSDIHKLFDKGYLTINPDYRIEVSSRIKEQFENGRDYYKFQGHKLVTIPQAPNQRPSLKYINWHNENVYQG